MIKKTSYLLPEMINGLALSLCKKTSGHYASLHTTVKADLNDELKSKYLCSVKYREVASNKQFQNSTSTPNEFVVERIVKIATHKEIKDTALYTLNN